MKMNSHSRSFKSCLVLPLVLPLAWPLALLLSLPSRVACGQADSIGNEQEASGAGAGGDFFAVEHIVDVRIEMDPADWQSLCGESRNFITSLGKELPEKPFTYYRAQLTLDGRVFENVGVRKKGFLGSLDSTRPSLKVKFDEFVKQDSGLEVDRLTLNNNKQDPSRVCQYLSYKLYNQAGVVAPRCNFARVTVNGVYLGAYSNVESIKAPFLKRRFGSSRGELYEGTVADFYPDGLDRFEPKNKGADLTGVRALADLLDQEDIDIDALNELVDVPAFVKFWAMESLLAAWDGYANNQNNYFVYRHPETGKFHFIPWGADSGFTDVMPLAPFRIKPRSVHSQAVLSNRLYRIPAIQTMYHDTMKQLLDDVWNVEELNAQIDRAVARLAEHRLPNEAPDDRIAEMKAFVGGRRAVVEGERENGIEIDHGARRPFFFEPFGSVEGSFATQWNEKTPPKPHEYGEATLRVEIDGEVIEFAQLGVTSEPSKDKNQREPDGQMPPTIVFHARRESDGKQWMLAVGTSSDNFHPSSAPVPVMGLIIEGNPLFFFAKMMLNPGKLDHLTMVAGEAQFAEAKRENGATVRGTLRGRVGRFRGGDHLPIR